MNDNLRKRAVFMLLAVVATTVGCTELRGRRRIREGSRLYREGNYAAARNEFQAAVTLVPQIPQGWLGQGLSCRQLMTPGATSPANDRAVDCALAALGELRRRWPTDPRGDGLYQQTLFDADRFPALVALYEERLKRDPADLAAVNGEIQAYTRWNHLEEALAAYQKKAALLPNDAEAQYAVGVFVWQQLFQRGGGPDKAGFDPRPDPDANRDDGKSQVHNAKRGKKTRGATHARGKLEKRDHHGAATATPDGPVEEPHKQPPSFAVGDITGAQRATLADLGIRYLQRALQLRPLYREPIVYLNLLLRQKSLAYLTRPSLWQACIDEAEKWRARAEALTPPAAAKGAAASPPAPGPATPPPPKSPATSPKGPTASP